MDAIEVRERASQETNGKGRGGTGNEGPGGTTCEPVFRHVGGQAAMQLRLRPGQGILSYQWHMLQENGIPGILPLSCREDDGQVLLSWRVSSLVPVQVLFSRRAFSPPEFIGLVRQIVVMMRQLDSLLLDEDRLLLDSRYVLADPIGLTLSFAYCPLMEPDREHAGIHTLLLRWLTKECRIQGNDAGNQLSPLLLVLREEPFHWSRLTCLAGLRVPSPDGEAFGESSGEASREVAGTGRTTVNQNHAVGFTSFAEDKPWSDNVVRHPPPTGEKEAFRPSLPAMRNRARAPVSRILPVQAVLLICLLVSLAGGVLTERGPDGVMARAGMILMGVALELWAFFGGKRPVAPPPVPTGPRPSASLAVTATAPFMTGGKLPAAEVPAPAACRTSAPSMETEETGLLVPEGVACLYPRLEGGAGQCMPIRRYPFLIGRLRDQVDGWLPHPTVGKMHAEIRIEAGCPQLIDLNSRNGTYVDGTLLQPYVPFRLKDGVILRIAGQELVYRGADVAVYRNAEQES